MHLVALTHVDNRQQTVVWQGVANHSVARPLALVARLAALVHRQFVLVRRQIVLVAREAWRQRFVVTWAEGYDFFSSRRRRRLLRASSSDD